VILLGNGIQVGIDRCTSYTDGTGLS